MTTRTVYNVVHDPAGSPVAGAQVTIALVAATGTVGGDAPGYVGNTRQTVYGIWEAVTDATGRWEAALHPNSGSGVTAPTGTVYRITEQRPHDRRARPYHFTVPDTAGPHWVGDLLTPAPGAIAPPGAITTGQLTAAIAAHAAVGDPHPAYVTDTELAANATADRARSNHTGTQPASTITGLAAVATSGSATDLTAGSLPAARIAAGLLTTAMLADGAVSSAKIADGTIVDADIAAGAAITGTKIAAASETARGTIEIATTAEAQAGSSSVLAVPPSALRSAVQRYIAQQGDNLWPDGYCMSGTSAFWVPGGAVVFDPATPVGRGGFKTTGAQQSLLSALDVAIDLGATYEFSAYARADIAAETIYVGAMCLDTDSLVVLGDHTYAGRFPGSVGTTLALPLNIGDTVVTLTDGSTWNNNTGPNYQRRFLWWPYTNGDGYTWPDYTYSRNVSSAPSTATWSSRTGNVLNLVVPWAGPSLPAGTSVANMNSHGTYQYAVSAQPVTTDWAKYTGTLTSIRAGTAYIRPIVLYAYANKGTTIYSCGHFLRRP